MTSILIYIRLVRWYGLWQEKNNPLGHLYEIFVRILLITLS